MLRIFVADSNNSNFHARSRARLPPFFGIRLTLRVSAGFSNQIRSYRSMIIQDFAGVGVSAAVIVGPGAGVRVEVGFGVGKPKFSSRIKGDTSRGNGSPGIA